MMRLTKLYQLFYRTFVVGKDTLSPTYTQADIDIIFISDSIEQIYIP